MDWIADHLAILMFLVLTFIMFIGYPVAFVVSGLFREFTDASRPNGVRA